jgi:tetratricopeptide (TPR) repeat protein
MGLAMRAARYFPMVVLAGFVCEAATPITTRAWDSAPAAASDNSYESQNNGLHANGAMQEGNDDSRPTSNATQIKSAGDPTSSRDGALFRGQSLSFPKLPFGRQKQNTRPVVQSPKPSFNQKPTIFSPMRQQANNQTTATSNPMQAGHPMQSGHPMQAGRPAQAGRLMPAGQPMQPRTMSGGQSVARNNINSNAGSNNRNPNLRTAANQQSQPVRQPSPQRPSPLAALQAPPPPVNNTTKVSPWKTAEAPAAGAAVAATAVATAPKPTAPPSQPSAPSPADKLVAQAHEWSTTAKTDEDYSRIIETCRRAEASQASPESIKYANKLTGWAFNRRGQLKAEAGHEQEAILDFDDAIRTDPVCWRAIHNRGVLLAQSGQFAKAFDDFARTIELEPQYAKAYSNRAALFMVANNLKAAQQDYNRAIELDANLAVAHRGCGRVCQLLGNLDEAAGHYDAAVQLAPNDSYAAACRADLLTDVGRYSEALNEYNRAIEMDPKSSQANCGSAWLLATCPDNSLRNPALAIERARQAVELGGQKDALSFDSLAAAQASAGDFTAAMQSIRKAIELAPADERDTYQGRLALYQKAKPYRISPIERVAQQVSYQTTTK